MDLETIFRWPPTPAKWRALKDHLQSLQAIPGSRVRISRSSSGTMISATKQAAPTTSGAALPFFPKLLRIPGVGEAPATYEATVTEGLLIERDVRNGESTDSVVYHEADNHRNEGALRKFPVIAAQSLFLVVEVNKLGKVAITPADPPADPAPPAVTLAVMATDTASTHYEPEIGEASEAGTPGTYYYAIADFVAGEEAGSVKMVRRMGGQNIDHWQALPTFENAGGETIWKEWSPATGVYKIKGITAVAPLTVTGNANDVELSFEGAADLDLKVRTVSMQVDSGNSDALKLSGSDPLGDSSLVTHYWRGGLYIGTTAPEGDPPAGLIDQTVTHVMVTV